MASTPTYKNSLECHIYWRIIPFCGDQKITYFPLGKKIIICVSVDQTSMNTMLAAIKIAKCDSSNSSQVITVILQKFRWYLKYYRPITRELIVKLQSRTKPLTIPLSHLKCQSGNSICSTQYKSTGYYAQNDTNNTCYVLWNYLDDSVA